MSVMYWSLPSVQRDFYPRGVSASRSMSVPFERCNILTSRSIGNCIRSNHSRKESTLLSDCRAGPTGCEPLDSRVCGVPSSTCLRGRCLSGMRAMDSSCQITTRPTYRKLPVRSRLRSMSLADTKVGTRSMRMRQHSGRHSDNRFRPTANHRSFEILTQNTRTRPVMDGAGAIQRCARVPLCFHSSTTFHPCIRHGYDLRCGRNHTPVAPRLYRSARPWETVAREAGEMRKTLLLALLLTCGTANATVSILATTSR